MKTLVTSSLIAIVSVLLIVLLPLAGIVLKGLDFHYYLHIPPLTGYTIHKPFCWPVFILLLTGIFLLIHPVLHIVFHNKMISKIQNRQKKFPWWGWCGIFLCTSTWFVAWTRFPEFNMVQRWTFTPLWISYIIIINSLSYWRTGKSLLTHDSLYLLKLFPLSATFWWIFEYLNRFTANWYYIGTGELSAIRYIAEASIAFSTVLPAVISTGDFLRGFPGIYAGMESYIELKCANRKVSWLTILILSGTGLALTGIFPEVLFPVLWVSPLLIVVSLSALAGDDTIFSEIGRGDWRNVIVYSLAALICGFFWEMWNINSMAKWIYSIPYVHRFKLFEMPLLGYAGYLPFGLECAVIAGLIRRKR